jgi:cytochrome c oxidase assembly factor CtaG
MIAHGLAEAAAHEWTWEPLVIVPLLVSTALYAAGLRRLWRHAGTGHGVTRWGATSFGLGTLTIAVALLSPVAWLSEILLSVHMTQHMLLMLVAAPLLMFGHPLLVWLWALAPRRRLQLKHPLRRGPVAWGWRAITAPLAVFLIQAIAIWIWHLPLLYEAALRHENIHALEHLSFVVAAALFWWGMVHGRYGRQGYGLAVVYVFLTAVYSSALGALLTVSPAAWYGEYVRQGAIWGVDPIADQQLAGLLMWIPAGVVFIVLGLALFAAWLGESSRRVGLGRTDALTRAISEARHAR